MNAKITWCENGEFKEKEFQDIKWLEASQFLIDNNIELDGIKVLEIVENGFTQVFTNNFNEWFYSKEELIKFK